MRLRTGLGKPLLLGPALAWLLSVSLPGQNSDLAQASNGSALPGFDFTQAADARLWQAPHDISVLQPTPEGLRLQITGGDPYLHGPARDYPAGRPLWLHLRLKSDQGGTCQVFYFRDAPTEERSVRFHVPGGRWFEAQAPLPALGPGYRLRIDPPSDRASCLLARLWCEERVTVQTPAWPKPEPPEIDQRAVSIRSGELRLVHARNRLGAFRLQVASHPMAVGHTRPALGYVVAGHVRWWGLTNPLATEVSAGKAPDGLTVDARFDDPDGGRWQIRQAFRPSKVDSAIDVIVRVEVDHDRDVIYLPMLTLLPGLGSYGTNKTQGLFAGVEYLENEPSSSEADLVGPAAKRQVPDSLKITFPLMTIQADGRYVGLIWEPRPEVCAVFDSPDRLFGSGGHVIGLLAPGSDGVNREEGTLIPYRPERLSAKNPLVLKATLIGGLGDSVVPAIQKYIALRGLPPVPGPGLKAQDYFKLAAHGWLDSKIREGNLYRHAAWPGFNPQPAADGALWMDWLAGQVNDTSLAGRLTEAARAALDQVQPVNYNATGVGHIRYPLPTLIYGSVAENVAQAQAQGQALLHRFQPEGAVVYRKPPNGVDYGRTHWSREANGLTAQMVTSLLETAAFSGDRGLISDGLRCLGGLEKFRDAVPRGAQTWEIPLHTPDILASAHLVRAYTLGYELTGETRLLEQARYWAWTGVPFVYLTPPTPEPVGLYNTIAVLGATGWKAPVWMGLPVQWCGLVYADALYRLVKHDPAGPWKQLADGITSAGIQQTWPSSDADRGGLLPDSFRLRTQMRDGPAINPATVQAAAIRLFGTPPVYDFQAFPRHGWLVHAPGAIRNASESAGGIQFTVSPWSPKPSWVLVAGVRAKPRVKVGDREIQLVPPHQYQLADGWLVLQIRNSAKVQILQTSREPP